MRKLLFILYFITAFFSGCSQTEVLDGSSSVALSFDTHIGKSSRAMAVSRFEEGDAIGVYMYQSPTSWATDGITGSNRKMENVSLRLDAGVWVYTPTQFWKQDEKYTFFAYAPYKENTVVNNGVLSYTVGADETTQEDLLYSVPSVQTKDRSWDGSVTVPDKVQFVFTHALSQVKFSVATEYDYSSLYTIELTGIKLHNIYTTGNLNLISENSVIEPWSGHSAPGAVTYSPAAITLNHTALQPVTNAAGDVWMLLPQTLPADAEVEFTVHLTKVGTTGTATDGDYTLKAPLTAGGWEHNKVYNYQVTLNMDQILGVKPIVIGEPEIIPWEEEPTQEIDPVLPTVEVNVPDAEAGSSSSEFSLTKKSGVGQTSLIRLRTGDAWTATVDEIANTRAGETGWLMLADDAFGLNPAAVKTGTGAAAFYIYMAKMNNTYIERRATVTIHSISAPHLKIVIRVTQKGANMPIAMKSWAGSNIYWDGSKLTFDDRGVTGRQAYHGVLFKWGSLAALTPTGEAYDAVSTILYTPTEQKSFAWTKLPFGGTWGFPAFSGDNFSYLLEIHDPARGIGDICKYITDMGWAPGANEEPRRQWRMPTGSELTFWESSAFSGSWPSSGWISTDAGGKNAVPAGLVKGGIFIPGGLFRGNIDGTLAMDRPARISTFYLSGSVDNNLAYCFVFSYIDSFLGMVGPVSAEVAGPVRCVCVN